MADVASELIQRAQARVGTTLNGKWRLDALLGVGGMACVYAATHRNAKRAAIKILHPELSIRGDIRARFVREGYVANTVDHPGAVSVLDDDVAEDGSAFIVMELLDGQTVLERMQAEGGRLAVGQVLPIADQLLDVLAAAHAKGIIHRDIKPENLLLDRSGQLKVLDFGIARLRESPDQSGTRTGSLMGTPSFMPPEQARGRWDEVDARADIWAVGATVFAALTGRMVHVATTANEALALAITERAPSLGTVMPDAPQELVAVVDRALAYDKHDRFEDARAMQSALRETSAAVLARAGSLPMHTAPTLHAAEVVPAHTPFASGFDASAKSANTKRRSVLPIVGGVAAVAVAALAALFFANRRAAPPAAGSAAAIPERTASAQPSPVVSSASAVAEPPAAVSAPVPPPPPAKPAPRPLAKPRPAPAPRPAPKPASDGLGGRL